MKSPRVIEAAGTTEQIRHAYDLWSRIYGKVAGPLEKGPRLRALELAGIQPRDRVLEVAVGTGDIFLEILRKVGKTNIAYGVDASTQMLKNAQRLAQSHTFTNAGLYRAAA